MTDACLPPQQRIPSEIRCAEDYESLAQRFLAAPTHAYIAGGSGQDRALEANRKAFARWSIYPRLLADVGQGGTALRLAGQELAHPLMLAPVAYQKLAHPLGELETARAAHATDTCMVLSTLSSYTLEEVASHAGKRWFQLYLQPDPAASLELVRRAEHAGYEAIVLTLDAPVQVASQRALRAQFHMPADCVAANLAPATSAPAALPAGASRIFQGMMAAAPGWATLDWLCAQTRLPVWVKGVMHADDARRLQAAGVQGLFVSNHGGRALDAAPASLDVLATIRAAVGPDYPLVFDGGVRCGSDVFKALALGAHAVALGRMQMYGLSVAGALGVAHMLRLMIEELEVCMALAGCARIADIGPAALMETPC